MIYEQVKVLPFDAHGWFLDEHKIKLTEFLTNHPVKTIIEVGSWLGASARFMAKLLPDDGMLFAVDVWEAWRGWQKGPEEVRKRVPTAYQQFLSNVIHEKLESKIVPVRLNSIVASKMLNIEADLIYIDADHEENAVYEDLKAWFPHLKPDGIMCGDDYCEEWGGTIVAVDRFAREHDLSVQNLGRFWWYTKK